MLHHITCTTYLHHITSPTYQPGTRPSCNGISISIIHPINYLTTPTDATNSLLRTKYPTEDRIDDVPSSRPRDTTHKPCTGTRTRTHHRPTAKATLTAQSSTAIKHITSPHTLDPNMADSNAPKPSSSVKLVLLGEAAVGKSSLVLRFVNNDFQENKEPTIGAAFLTQKCNLPTRTIKFEIWDTAGQERFASLAPMYYRNAQAALVVYDLTKPTSLVKAKHWVAELQRQASPGIVIALVGNKLDLTNDAGGGSGGAAADGEDQDGAGDARKVSTEEAKAYAEEEGLLFFETSAKTGHNVTEVFTAIANAIPETSLKSARGPGAANTVSRGGDEQRVNLTGPRDQAGKEGCAC